MAKCYNTDCNARYVTDDGYACCRWEKCPDFDGIKTTVQDEPKCGNLDCPVLEHYGFDCPGANGCKKFVPTRTTENMVDHPAHYQGEYECIDLMREIYGDEAVRHFCICNAYKYRFRAGKKNNEAARTAQEKAEWYERYMMERLMQNNTLAWERRRREEQERNAYCETE